MWIEMHSLILNLFGREKITTKITEVERENEGHNANKDVYEDAFEMIDALSVLTGEFHRCSPYL